MTRKEAINVTNIFHGNEFSAKEVHPSAHVVVWIPNSSIGMFIINKDTIIKYSSNDNSYSIIRVADAPRFALAAAQYTRDDSFYVHSVSDLMEMFNTWLWVQDKLGSELKLGVKHFYSMKNTVIVGSSIIDFKRICVEFHDGRSTDYILSETVGNLAKDIFNDLQEA